MKKKDILLVAVIAIIAGTFSYLIANYLFGGEKAYKLKAPTVQAISVTFEYPPKEVYNKDALNPTKSIIIGDTTNNAPFKTTQ